ncbi:MAG: SUMF1/EgtB/PvdO family nonheme iron enzyme [Candidatus Omnitrophica bacterium]|nr:SUMF1/EgtB/PvdO family nonheme iron enzyme [Candidatus Omnitrophota bacterium]
MVALCIATPAFANNLVISNVTLEDRNPTANTMVVQFNISWDHSWRKNDGRHDAAWVFVKINNSTPPWKHGLLYTAGTNPTNTSPGTNSDLKIVIPSDKVGAFISRTATGNGTFSSQKVRLTVDYGSSGIADTDTVQVKVFGIEMVYIPEGSFYIGSGGVDQDRFYTYPTDTTTYQITSEAAITVGTSAGNLYYDSIFFSSGDQTGPIPAAFPKGYNAFYLMKYELTNGQYVDFLNTLSRVQQGTRVHATVSGNTIANYYVMRDSTTPTSRTSIRAPASGNGTSPTTIVFGNDLNNNGVFNEANDGHAVEMTWCYWTDLLAYADWSGLRPYTELEYTKAARGPLTPIPGEYAWGSSNITLASSIVNDGRISETAGQSGEGLTVYNNTIAGALRVGFAATNASNRKSAGAGYYGNMELTGNAVERVVSAGSSIGRAFTGTHGNGTLTTTTSYEGNATNTDWPGINATTARGVNQNSGCGLRGGNYNTSSLEFELSLSSRVYAETCSADVGGTSGAGRLARTAP